MSAGHGKRNVFARIVYGFNRGFGWLQGRYDNAVHYCLERPALVIAVFSVFVLLSFALSPFLGRAYFPRTDPGQFVISVKAPTGTRIELTDQYIARVEDDVRAVVAPKDLKMIVSNIGVTPDLSAIYTPNFGMHTAFVQVSLKEEHSLRPDVSQEQQNHDPSQGNADRPFADDVLDGCLHKTDWSKTLVSESAVHPADGPSLSVCHRQW